MHERNRQSEAAEKMHKKRNNISHRKRIRRAALKAGVMILLLTGCTRRTEIHMDGLREESFSETEQERQTEVQTGVSSVIYVYVCGAVQTLAFMRCRMACGCMKRLLQPEGFGKMRITQWLNQAAPVQDGQRLYVYTQEEVQALAANASQTTGGEREEMQHTEGST